MVIYLSSLAAALQKSSGQTLALGSTRLLRELGLEEGPLHAEAQHLEQQGRTVSWLVQTDVDQQRLLGLLAFGDTVKPAAADAISRRHQLGIRTVMLTGYNRGAAEAVASELGISDVRAEVLPGDKAAIVKELRDAGKVVAFSSVSVVLNALTLRRWHGVAGGRPAAPSEQQAQTMATLGEQR